MLEISEIKDKMLGFGITEDRIKTDEPMSRHTSFRIGGPADVMVTCNDEKELAELLAWLSAEGIEHMIVGNGSDLLFRDGGYRGVIVVLGGEFGSIELDPADAGGEAGNDEEKAASCEVTAGSARLLSSVSAFAYENGLTGFEFAGGIPGSVGGAIFMNAGAYGGEMKDIVKSVRLMKSDGSEIFSVPGSEMDFAYRNSRAQKGNEIVLSATFSLEHGDKEEIKAKITDFYNRRSSKQPLNFASAGSTFKRPVGGYAAALIEEAGLKGEAVGDAEVSTKHSGFIINRGSASCKDVLELMETVKKRVYENSGIMLEPEVRIVGSDTEVGRDEEVAGDEE